MGYKYLIRLDDACPTMNVEKWARVEDILNKYNICPMVGIIPDNKNPHEEVCPPDPMFWGKARAWENKGWTIALHGYDHCYISDNAGINPLWKRSEFAGLPLEVQREKIRKGVAILKENGLNPKFFFAPSHTYDNNTLRALELESQIRVISDTIGFHPYKDGSFIFIPVLGGHCKERKMAGEWTFCLHPNTMSDSNIDALDVFLSTHKDSFVSFSSLDLKGVEEKDLRSRVFSWLYFTYRKFRKVK